MKGAYHTAVLCNGRIYIGGRNVGLGFPSYRIDVYTPAKNSWSKYPINTPYHWFAMTTLNNQLITAGGDNKSHNVTNMIFSLNGDHLKLYNRMITPRYLATAVGHQGILIITGGSDEQHRTLATTELFDSATKGRFSTGQWYTSSNLSLLHRGLHSVLVDNTLYLLGGWGNDGISPAVFCASLDTLSSHKVK